MEMNVMIMTACQKGFYDDLMKRAFDFALI